jgi:hypothetical protein
MSGRAGRDGEVSEAKARNRELRGAGTRASQRSLPARSRSPPADPRGQRVCRNSNDLQASR